MQKVAVQVFPYRSHLVKPVQQGHTENAYHQRNDDFERRAHRGLSGERRSHGPYYRAVQNETVPPRWPELKQRLQDLLPESPDGLAYGFVTTSSKESPFQLTIYLSI